MADEAADQPTDTPPRGDRACWRPAVAGAAMVLALTVAIGAGYELLATGTPAEIRANPAVQAAYLGA